MQRFLPGLLAVGAMLLLVCVALYGIGRASPPPQAEAVPRTPPQAISVTITPLPAPFMPPPAWSYTTRPLAAVPAYDDVPPHITSAPLPPVPLMPPAVQQDTWPKIVIVLDDMGVSPVNTRRAIQLPVPLTLSYLPYARGLAQQTAAAAARGHTLMLHMPMESLGGNNAGPGALLTGLPAEELQRRTRSMLDSFSGYIGVNNHMGSKFTADSKGLAAVMPLIRQRGVFFLDSRTSSHTLAEETASAHDIPALRRDVFLDDTDTPAAVRHQLQQTEKVARRQGYAIAIGHPRPNTVNALREWIGTLEKKKLQIVGIGDVVNAAVAPGALTSTHCHDCTPP